MQPPTPFALPRWRLRLVDMMHRLLLADLPAGDRTKFRFIHCNHTNLIRDPNSPQSQEVLRRGFGIARRGDRICF